MTCEKCGQAHVNRNGDANACVGHKRAEDGTLTPCRNFPRRGATVCAYHGANTPQARAAAEARLAEQEATKQVKTLGLALDITPTDALLQEVQWTAGHVQWLREKVQEIDEHELVWGKTRVKEGGEDRGVTEEAKPNVWLALYQSERDHLVKVCSAALRAGVEERKVRLAESQGDLVVAVIRRILDGLLAALLTAGLSDERLNAAWTTAVADIVPRELRAIAGGA